MTRRYLIHELTFGPHDVPCVWIRNEPGYAQ
jgi:hypothetical protein